MSFLSGSNGGWTRRLLLTTVIILLSSVSGLWISCTQGPSLSQPVFWQLRHGAGDPPAARRFMRPSACDVDWLSSSVWPGWAAIPRPAVLGPIGHCAFQECDFPGINILNPIIRLRSDINKLQLHNQRWSTMGAPLWLLCCPLVMIVLMTTHQLTKLKPGLQFWKANPLYGNILKSLMYVCISLFQA